MSLSHLLQSNVSLQPFNTFGIAASAQFYVRIETIAQLQHLQNQFNSNDLPRLVLGGGSNLILTNDFQGLVLHMVLKGRERVNEDDRYVYVRAAAGEVWHDFVQWTLANGWGGLENLSLISGNVGAAPIQNIGAYGVEVQDYFDSLSWFEFTTGKIHTFKRADCRFAYRDSVFKHALFGQGIILDVTFALPKHWQAQLNYGDVAQHLREINSPTSQQISAAICQVRQSKLPNPNAVGNVGSFFKNPIVSVDHHDQLLKCFPQLVSHRHPDGGYKLAAGWLIEKAGWKGRALGRVGVYEKQALVLINLGGATGSEVLELAYQIQADVKLQFEVRLEIEPVCV